MPRPPRPSLVTSCRMGNSEDDPGAETQMFRAYVEGADRPTTDFRSQRSRLPIGLAVVGVAVLVAVVVLILTS